MNCDDVAHVLDSREIAALSPFDRQDFEAHLEHCGACAAQRLVSERLRSFRAEVPPLPAPLTARAWQLDEALAAAARERRLRRPVLVRSLLLLGVAATLFTAIPWSDSGAEPVQ
jgi:hypothetical protein